MVRSQRDAKRKRRRARERLQATGKACGVSQYTPRRNDHIDRICHFYAGHNGQHEFNHPDWPDHGPCDCHLSPLGGNLEKIPE